MYGIARPDVHRGTDTWRRTAALYVVAALAAGAATGAILAAAGLLMPDPARAGIATLLGFAAVAVSVLALRGRRIRPLQLDRETPFEWTKLRPETWAILNGFALGNGGLTRLGYVLWYAIPLGALLSGSVVAGAVLYGAYGFVRALGAPLLIVRARRSATADSGDALLLARSHAERLVNVQTGVLGISIVALVGFVGL